MLKLKDREAGLKRIRLPSPTQDLLERNDSAGTETVIPHEAIVLLRHMRPIARTAALLAAMFACGIVSEVAQGSSIETIIDRSSGEVFLKNPTAGAMVIDGYSLFSPAGSLLPGAWSSVTDLYDVSGDGSVDTSTDWFVIASTANSIAEVSPIALTGSLDAGQIVSLGLIWTLGHPESLATTVSVGATTTDMIGDFRTLTADYDNDLDVDTDDYDIFVATFGSTVDLRADGNANGVIDAADYTVWRDSEELVLGGGSSFLSSGSPTTGNPSLGPIAVPEPTSVMLLLVGGLATAATRRR